MRLPNTAPTAEGLLLWPSLGGGSNWYSSTFSPQTNFYYVNEKEEGAVYVKGAAEFKAGAFFNGGGQRPNKAEEPFGAVRALDAKSAAGVRFGVSCCGAALPSRARKKL